MKGKVKWSIRVWWTAITHLMMSKFRSFWVFFTPFPFAKEFFIALHWHIFDKSCYPSLLSCCLSLSFSPFLFLSFSLSIVLFTFLHSSSLSFQLAVSFSFPEACTLVPLFVQLIVILSICTTECVPRIRKKKKPFHSYYLPPPPKREIWFFAVCL